MRRPNTISNKIEKHSKKETPYETPREPSTPVMEVKSDEKVEEKHVVEQVKMDLEEVEKQVDIDALLKQDDPKEENCINLDEAEKPKKNKKKYDLDDTVLKDIILSTDTRMRLISNINGYFVDIRKFFRGYPSQKGIRISAGKFLIAAEHLKKEIEPLKLPGLKLDS